jgi:hypothetical protein
MHARALSLWMNPHNGTKILVHGRREIWGSKKQLEVPSSNFIHYLVLETTGYDMIEQADGQKLRLVYWYVTLMCDG